MKSWAQANGTKDGKAEVPGENWGRNSVPFFNEALAEYQMRAKTLILKSRELFNSQMDAIFSRAKEVEFLQQSFVTQKQVVDNLERRIQNLKDLLSGYKEELPLGRFARVQAISSIVHFPTLLILALGEFFVTQEAVIEIIGSDRDEAIMVAVAVALLTIMGAHLLGTLLKLKLDRHRPQENWVINVPIVLAISLVVVIALLAVVRAGVAADGGAAALERIMPIFLIESFLVLLFFCLQLTFLIVGSVMAFLHYSPVSHELHAAKWSFIIEKRRLNQTRGKIAKLSSDLFLGRELVKGEVESINAKAKVLGAEYLSICAAYKSANIHARRDELDASHISMQEPDFLFESNEFTDIIELSEEDFTKREYLISG
jgi:hypothetical protein